MSTAQRRLAAILVADVVGYSKLMGSDEAGTLAHLHSLRTEIIEAQLAKHAGRLFKSVGDGFLIEFSSAVQAVNCAKAIQEANRLKPLSLRIGIHVGDVVVQGNDLMGDGVNVAARIEGVAQPGGIALSRAVHEQVRDKLDLGFVDKGEIELKNIARPVQVFVVGGAKAPPAPGALPLPDKPSIAVLPFQNMSGDPEQEYFADGMVEEIITALSRTKALFVIARNSSFSYKGKSPDIRQVGRELGVRYVLEGSVRKAGSRVRITGQLIDARSGAHLWADRFDGDLSDIFALQDEIASRIAVSTVPALEQEEIRRFSYKPTDNLDAYDCSLRGWACIDQLSREANDKALTYFKRAIELDPNFALAWAQVAGCYVQRKAWRWADDPEREAKEAERLARRALKLDSNDPRVITLSGFALGYLAGFPEESLSLFEKATELDPNFFFAWLRRGFACLRLGKPSIPHFERALRLNPRDLRAPFAKNGLASAYLQAGNVPKAAELAEDALRQLPGYPPALLTLITAYAHTGQVAEAREKVKDLLNIRPGATISNVVLEDNFPGHRELVTDGCRLAGLPE
jgi:adenylate cyclase